MQESDLYKNEKKNSKEQIYQRRNNLQYIHIDIQVNVGNEYAVDQVRVLPNLH